MCSPIDPVVCIPRGLGHHMGNSPRSVYTSMHVAVLLVLSLNPMYLDAGWVRFYGQNAYPKSSPRLVVIFLLVRRNNVYTKTCAHPLSRERLFLLFLFLSLAGLLSSASAYTHVPRTILCCPRYFESHVKIHTIFYYYYYDRLHINFNAAFFPGEKKIKLVQDVIKKTFK